MDLFLYRTLLQYYIAWQVYSTFLVFAVPLQNSYSISHSYQLSMMKNYKVKREYCRDMVYIVWLYHVHACKVRCWINNINISVLIVTLLCFPNTLVVTRWITVLISHGFLDYLEVFNANVESIGAITKNALIFTARRTRSLKDGKSPFLN